MLPITYTGDCRPVVITGPLKAQACIPVQKNEKQGGVFPLLPIITVGDSSEQVCGSNDARTETEQSWMRVGIRMTRRKTFILERD